MSGLAVLMAFAWIPQGSEINEHLYPENIQSIVVVDLESVRRTGMFDRELREGFQAFLEENEHMTKLGTILGVDLLDSTKSFTICAGGRMGPDGDALTISNGDFSFDKFSGALEKLTEQGELSVLEYNDLPIYYNHRSREALYFAIVDDGVMIASNRKAVLEDAIQGLTDLRKPDQVLIDRLKWSAEDTKDLEVKPSVYLAGVFPEAAREQLEKSPLNAIAKDMIGYNLTIHVGEKFLFRGRLEMASESSCERASKLFDVFFKLMRTSMENRSPNRTDQQEFFDSVEIKANKKDLMFNITAPGSLISQIQENDRKDPNSPRNRMRRLREERKKALERGEEPPERLSDSPMSDVDIDKELEKAGVDKPEEE